MMKSIAVGIGIAVGVVAVGAVVYYCYRQKQRQLKTTNVDTLSWEKLKAIYNERKVSYKGVDRLILTVPTAENLRSLGFAGVNIDMKKDVLITFYDSHQEMARNTSLLHCERIETALQSRLMEATDGILILKDLD